MKLSCVLTAVNKNEIYINFIPLFINSWSKLYPNIDIKIILISNTIPEQFKQYENYIILFKPLLHIKTSFISQYIRLLYPSILKYSDGVLITDIDIIPMSNTYFTKNIENINNNKFVYFRGNVCLNINEIAMCYNIATPKVWNDIFKIKSLEDIKSRLIYVYNSKYSWSIDQLDLYKYVMKWNKNTNNLIILNDINTKFNRLDRASNINIHIEKNNILEKKYTDYHCLRPMTKYNHINNAIYHLLLESLQLYNR